MEILRHIGEWLASGLVVLGLISAPAVPVIAPTVPGSDGEPVVGATVPNTPALYDAYLTSGISSSDTSMTLSSATTRDGISLSGYTCFVIDINSPIAEYVCGTASGATITSLNRGIKVSDPTASSTSLAFAHRRLASVSVADYPTIQVLAQKVNGTDTLDNIISYTNKAAGDFTDANEIPNKAYVDNLAFGGIPAASATASGFVEIATPTEVASSTPTGSTGAVLAIPASQATSSAYTTGSSLGRGVIPATGANGKIDTNLLDLTTIGSSLALASSTTIGDFPAFSIGKHVQVFTTTGTSTFTVPSGVTTAYVEVQAGGGTGGSGGGAGTNGTGSGGGGGGYANKIVDLTGTTSVQVYVGSAGEWSTFGTNGSYFYATGGTNPTGGIGTNGDVNLQGDDGELGTPACASSCGSTSATGNGGSSHMGGGGAVADNSNTAGAAGHHYGGGGGGGKGSGGGGAGSQGIVVIRW